MVNANMPAQVQPAVVLVNKEKPLSKCTYCDMSFKKLEHAQRHERTHTLDRPYACNSCGKTFARQDTLNRHARLHIRKTEEGPNTKAPRRRKSSSASTKPTPVFLDEKTLDPNEISIPRPLSPTSPLPRFSFSLPAMVPTVPAYSRPTGPDDSARFYRAPDMPVRRYSDVPLGAVQTSLTSRQRAATFSEGTFTIADSPMTDSSSSSSEVCESPSAVCEVASSYEPESIYPSPAFTSYSPTSLHDTMSDLEAILANDPFHASMTNAGLLPQTASPNEEEAFDFESFSASIEGRGPTPAMYTDAMGSGTLIPCLSERSSSPSSKSLTSSHFNLDYGFGTQSAFTDPPPRPLGHSRGSLSLPSFHIPTLSLLEQQSFHPEPRVQQHQPASSVAAGQYPSAALAAAYASSFPSLSVVPNTLGLCLSPEQILYEAYLKRRSAPNLDGTSGIAANPALYIPSSTSSSDHMDKPLSPSRWSSATNNERIDSKDVIASYLMT